MFAPLLIATGILGFIVYSNKEQIVNQTSKIIGKVNNDYDHLFIKYGQKYGIDWKLLKRIAYIESNIGLNPRVKRGIEVPSDIKGSTSSDGLSWGLMQTTVSTARAYMPNVTEMQLNNPEISISLGAQHFAWLKRNYPQLNERDLVMSYNHGQGNQLKFISAEKAGTLSSNSYLAGRNYYSKYLKAKELIP